MNVKFLRFSVKFLDWALTFSLREFVGPAIAPLIEIRDYFGEKIAMYFGWLGVYTTFLLYACPAGFLTFWVSFGFRSPDCPLTPYMAAFMVR